MAMKWYSIECPFCSEKLDICDRQRTLHCSRCGKYFSVETKRELSLFEIGRNPTLLSKRPLWNSVCDFVEMYKRR